MTATPPEPRPEVVELLRDLAARNALDGADAAGIAWETRYRWSTADERAAAYDWVVGEIQAARAMYVAAADQQDAGEHAWGFDEARWLNELGVSLHDDDGRWRA